MPVSVSVPVPALITFNAPLIEPPKVEAAPIVVRVASEPLFWIVPPWPGRMFVLLIAPMAWLLPFSSKTPVGAFIASALTVGTVPLGFMMSVFVPVPGATCKVPPLITVLPV